MKEFSVVVPVYRSGKTLKPLYQKLTEVFGKIGLAYEIIFVDDRGDDETWKIIEALVNDDNNVIGVKLSRNYGQQAATICGFSLASGSWVITIDDDLEQNPERIHDLYSKAKEGYVVVYGVYTQRTHSFWRNLTSLLAKKLFKIAIPSLNHEYTSYRIIKGEAAKKICDFTSPFPFIDGYLSWITNNYATVSIEHNQREHGKSNYNFRKLFELTINTFVTFSDLPLKFASYAGILSFISGSALAFYILVGKVIGNITVSGYASLMAGILLFGGMQMLILGIIGEYLGRIGFKTSAKPLFIVERIERGESVSGGGCCLNVNRNFS